MLAVGILGVVTLGFASVITRISRDQKGLGEKLAQIEVFQSLIQALAQIPICTNTLTTPVQIKFNAAALPANASVPSGGVPLDATNFLLKIGQPANATAPSLIVQSVDLVNIGAAGSADTWHGQVQVTFNTTPLVRALHPVLVDVFFKTDPASPLTAKLVTGCTSSGGGSGGGGPPASLYEEVCNSSSSAPKGDVYTAIPSGAVPCTPPSCLAGDTDLGIAGCRNLSAGKYHGTYMCYRNCANGTPIAGQSYNRYCGWATSPLTCTPFTCGSGTTISGPVTCSQNGSGYSAEPIGSCTATYAY